MSYKEFKVWLELHPADREQLESPVTVVRRAEQAAQYPVPLEVTPYSKEYSQFLAPAATHLLQVSRPTLSLLVFYLSFTLSSENSPPRLPT